MVLVSELLQMAVRDKYRKVIAVGEHGVGITSFIRRYAEGIFPEFISEVEGLDYRLKVVKKDDMEVRIQIWDQVYNQRSRYIHDSFKLNTEIVFLVYDVTNKKSFLELEFWLSQVKEVPRKIIIGNKCDLQSKREVPINEVENFAKRNEVEFLEVSAKEGTNMDLDLSYFNISLTP